jgi:hypothetical protein
MSGRTVAAAVAALTLVLGGAGCATARQVYTPAELREVLAATPGYRSGDVVVPWELPPEALARVPKIVDGVQNPRARVGLLVEAMFDPAGFGLVRDLVTSTTTGAEALAQGRGNCVALASVFVGLARAAGLDARYVDASSRVNERRYGDDGTTVDFGHVSAIVNTGSEKLGLDFARAGPFRWYRELDDLEAVAHFHNNRGYELVDRARAAGEPPDWPEAARRFELAVAVKPRFARAWNNLGVAASHLERRAAAVACWRRAAALDPAMAAPRANLGALHLREGDLPEALGELDAAARLDPAGAHIHYNLALARLRSGDREGALAALRRTLSLRGTYPGAQALLERLAPGSPGAAGD